jgi:hypothetical protein
MPPTLAKERLSCGHLYENVSLDTGTYRSNHPGDHGKPVKSRASGAVTVRHAPG